MQEDNQNPRSPPPPPPARSLHLFLPFTRLLPFKPAETHSRVLSDFLLRESWQPFYSEPPHYLLNVSVFRHKGRWTSGCASCALFPYVIQLEPAQGRCCCSESWARNHTLHMRPAGAGRGRQEGGKVARHSTTGMWDWMSSWEGGRRTEYLDDLLQSAPGQWAIRGKCWWLGRHSVQTRPPVNPMNLHHDISLLSLHGKPGTGCFSKNECEWNKNSVKTKKVKYSWCSQHHLGVFCPDPSPLQVRTTCRAIALITDQLLSFAAAEMSAFSQPSYSLTLLWTVACHHLYLVSQSKTWSEASDHCAAVETSPHQNPSCRNYKHVWLKCCIEIRLFPAHML